LSLTKSVSDEEFVLCQFLCAILEPVNLSSDRCCSNDASLINDDAAISFRIDTLTKESANNNMHAIVIKDSVIKRINERRKYAIVQLMKYYVNGDILHQDTISNELQHPFCFNKAELQILRSEIMFPLLYNVYFFCYLIALLGLINICLKSSIFL